MKKQLFLLGVFLAAVTVCQAESIRVERIPKTAKWAAHLDVDKFKGSALCKLILDEMNNQEATERVISQIEIAGQAFGFNPVQIAQDLRSQGVAGTLEESAATADRYLGFNPLRDVTGITMYGSEFKPKEGVILLRGIFKTQNLINLLNTDPSRLEHPYKSYVIYEWTSPYRDRKGFVTFYSDNLIILGSSEAYVQESLDVMDGSGENISSSLALQSLPEIPAGAIFVAAAVEFSQIPEIQPKSAMLSQMDELTVVLGEVDQNVYVDLGMTAQSVELADQTQQFIYGMLAFAEINRQNFPLVADLAQAVQVNKTDRVLKVSLEGTTEEVFILLKKIREHKKEMAAQTQTQGQGQ
jgi:hypothetical protein